MALDMLFNAFILFLTGLAIFAITTFFLSKNAKLGFDGTNSRINEAGYYLNEFRKQSNALKRKATEKLNAAQAEKEIAWYAKELGIREEEKKEKDKEKIRAVARR